MSEGEVRPIVEVSELGVAVGGVTELDKLSFKLAAGEALIVLGDAVSGKDALLRVLGGFTARSEVLSGTIQYGEGAPLAAEKCAKPAIRIVYLAGAADAPLNPNASVGSQLTRVLARRRLAIVV